MEIKEERDDITIVYSLLSFLGRLEEGIEYEYNYIKNKVASGENTSVYIGMLELVRSDESSSVFNNYMDALIRNSCPTIQFVDKTKFKVVYSKIFRYLSPVHRVLEYLGVHKPKKEVYEPIEIPDRLRTKEFFDYVDNYYYFDERNNGWDLTDEGLAEKGKVDDAIYKVTFHGKDIDEVFTKFYGVTVPSGRSIKSKAVTSLKKSNFKQ